MRCDVAVGAEPLLAEVTVQFGPGGVIPKGRRRGSKSVTALDTD